MILKTLSCFLPSLLDPDPNFLKVFKKGLYSVLALQSNEECNMKNPKSILITGGTSGIGEYLALNYAQPGVHLSISGRNQPRLDKICAKIIDKGATVEGRIIDVSDKAASRGHQRPRRDLQ